MAEIQEKKIAEMVNVVKEFRAGSSAWITGRAVVHAVSDVSFHINEGETFALVGESGCGKSTVGRLMLNLIEPTRGKVLFDGKELGTLSNKEMHKTRREMQIVFQDPYASLNPRMKVRDIIAEPLVTHRMHKSKEDVTEKVREIMGKVGIRPAFMNRYPHQFSGGQRQRIGIARALALNPRLVVCDEPISALDVSIQSQILNLLKDLQDEMQLTYLFISHDLSVVRYLSDRVCVMFLGKVCEYGNTESIYENPQHPYTKSLLDAVPKADPMMRKEKKTILTGEIPSPINPPSGCRFRTRCPLAKDVCAAEEPMLKEINGRLAACHLI